MSQSLSNLLVHLIFSTKERMPLINPAFQNELYKYMGGVSKNLQAPAIEIGGIEDHVHMLVLLPRTLTISELVKKLKNSSTFWLKKNYDQHKFSWQRGYGAFSVSHSSLEKVKGYIQNQKDLHKNRTFQDEFRLILNMHQVTFSEEYLWE